MKKGEGERCIQTPGLKNSVTYSIFIGCLSAFLDQTFVETLREELAKSFFFSVCIHSTSRNATVAGWVFRNGGYNTCQH